MAAADSLTICNVYAGACGGGLLHRVDGIGFLRHVIESTSMGRRWLYALKTFWCVRDAITGLSLTTVQRHTIMTPRMPGIWRWVLFFWMLWAPQTSRGQIVWGLTVGTTNSLFIRGKWYSNTIYNQDVWISAFILLFTEKGRNMFWWVR